MPKPVLTKRDFVRRYQQGEFGNRSPTWEATEWYNRAYLMNKDGRFHLRSKVVGGPTFYDLSWVNTFCEIADIMSEARNFYVSEMAPHKEHGTIQGEVCRSIRHYDLTWTVGALPMREALSKWFKTSCGLDALRIMKCFMDQVSYEWVQYLLDAYEDHIVEFSCFSRPWGTIPGRNTVIWEVRYGY